MIKHRLLCDFFLLHMTTNYVAAHLAQITVHYKFDSACVACHACRCCMSIAPSCDDITKLTLSLKTHGFSTSSRVTVSRACSYRAFGFEVRGCKFKFGMLC